MVETSGTDGQNGQILREVVPGADHQPLLEASKRLRKPRGGKNRKLDDKQRGIAIGMAAVGVPQNKIAQALEVKTRVIETLAQNPNNNELIYDIRARLKLKKMQKALKLEEKLWDLVEAKIDAGDAKAVDGAMRAVHASEKIQQGVAGESQKIEHLGSPQAVDLAGLIQVLIQSDQK
jgi:hypothetical protein